jgi:hypothetical protein
MSNNRRSFKEGEVWQYYEKNFLGGWSFPNGDETVTIVDAFRDIVYDRFQSKMIEKTIIQLKEKDLPMVLGKQNSAIVASVCGSDYPIDWIGKKIIVGTKMRKDRETKEMRPVIDIKRERPSESITRRASEEQIAAIRNLIETGVIKNESAMCKFFGVSKIEDMSPENAAEIIRRRGENK